MPRHRRWAPAPESLTTVFDNACLAFLEMQKPSTSAVSYSGIITAVAE